MHPPLPGLCPAPAILFDERRRPDFRDVFGALARRSERICTAVTRVRLTTIDLGPDELGTLRSFRVLLSEMNALRMESEAHALIHMRRRAPGFRLLTGLLESGALEVRSAPLGGWSPDFTVFADNGGARWVLSGFHAFERPYPHRGPALASLHGEDGAQLAQRRYDELWAQGHDVGPTLWTLLSRAQRSVAGAGR